MIWQCTEILAVIVECMIVTRMLIQYFKFRSVFYAPHSRHTGISREDVDNCKALRILAESDAAGPLLMSTENGRQTLHTGHPQ